MTLIVLTGSLNSNPTNQFTDEVEDLYADKTYICNLMARFPANKTGLSAPVVFLLTVPRRIFCCSSPLLVHLWFHTWRLCCPYLFLIMPRHQKSGGVICYTLWNFECPSIHLSVRPSICPSVSAPTIRLPATPTVLGQSFSNFTGTYRMVWRYAYCFFRNLKLFFITFFFHF